MDNESRPPAEVYQIEYHDWSDRTTTVLDTVYLSYEGALAAIVEEIQWYTPSATEPNVWFNTESGTGCIEIKTIPIKP